MNTKVKLWLKPVDMGGKRCYSKVFFNVIIEGDHTSSENEDIENMVNIRDIMDFADIHSNWNYGIESLSKTKKRPCIAFATTIKKHNLKQQAEHNPKQQAEMNNNAMLSNLNKIAKLGELELKKDEVLIQDNGKLHIVKNDLKIQEIDFPEIWAIIEKNIIGKVKEGDSAIIKDDDGNVLIELEGGSFLNVGLADLSIYDKKKMAKKRSVFSHGQGLKGGLFIRDDGRLCIGDFKRTFYLQIHTSKLIQACLKANKSISEFMKTKFIE